MHIHILIWSARRHVLLTHLALGHEVPECTAAQGNAQAHQDHDDLEQDLLQVTLKGRQRGAS